MTGRREGGRRLRKTRKKKDASPRKTRPRTSLGPSGFSCVRPRRRTGGSATRSAVVHIYLYRRAAFSKAPRNRVFRCFRKEESAVRRERARRAKERRWRRKGCSASSGSVRRARWWFGNQVRAVSGFASAVDFWRFPFNDREILRSNALGPVLKPKPTIFGSASRRNQFGAD